VDMGYGGEGGDERGVAECTPHKEHCCVQKNNNNNKWTINNVGCAANFSANFGPATFSLAEESADLTHTFQQCFRHKTGHSVCV